MSHWNPNCRLILGGLEIFWRKLAFRTRREQNAKWKTVSLIRVRWRQEDKQRAPNVNQVPLCSNQGCMQKEYISLEHFHLANLALSCGCNYFEQRSVNQVGGSKKESVGHNCVKMWASLKMQLYTKTSTKIKQTSLVRFRVSHSTVGSSSSFPDGC